MCGGMMCLIIFHLILYSIKAERKNSGTAEKEKTNQYMKYILYILSLSFVFACSDPEPTGPESNCDLMSLYKIGFNSVHASDIFDVGISPEKEINDITLKNVFFYQYIFYLAFDQRPFPYNEFSIDTVWFHQDLTATIEYIERGPKHYSFTQNDCQVGLLAGDDVIKAELVDGGEEIFINQYAIFDLQQTNEFRDTFVFIEFRPEEFKSAAEVIAEFAADHPGEFDTVAIQLIENRSNE